VTQPLPEPLIQRGTFSSTEAVHKTCVSPNLARQEPSAYLAALGVKDSSRKLSKARELGRGDVDIGCLQDCGVENIGVHVPCEETQGKGIMKKPMARAVSGRILGYL
jgi:hypothetical protein